MSAYSTNGHTWKREDGVRKQSGGFHDIDMAYYCFVHKPENFNDNWEIFYHSSTQVNGNWISKIIRSSSKDGLKWIDHQKPVLISPINELAYDQIRAPHLIENNQGWRLFFSARGKDKKTRILSVFSKNRIDWQLEPVIEIDSDLCNNLIDQEFGKVTDVTDPFIIHLDDGTMRIYFSTIHGSLFRQNIASAISKNGENWEIESNFRLAAGSRKMTNCVCNPCVIKMGKEWRIFFRGGDIYPIWNNIFSAKSNDGVIWNDVDICLQYQRLNINERNAVAFPFVCQIDNFGYRMYYTGYWGTIFDRTIIHKYMEDSRNFLYSFVKNNK